MNTAEESPAKIWKKRIECLELGFIRCSDIFTAALGACVHRTVVVDLALKIRGLGETL